MLYPLNALIEGQRERLSAWTRPFRGRIRYGLYNGDRDRSAPESERRRTPERVIDRERLRQSPHTLLVTNVTMLEYMLVRADDRPILEVSRGRLKWIVPDEAHSLVGAVAAEIALPLRRVMLAFAVEPDQVRFVATFGTIGSGDDVKERLQRFLADVAGISEARVHVIEGKRRLPERPSAAARSRSRRVGSSGREPERLAPIRLHAFERSSPGLWSRVNPACKEATPEWPFGALRHERADARAACGAPALEIVSCVEAAF